MYLLYVVFRQLPVEIESQLFNLRLIRDSRLEFRQQAHHCRFTSIKTAPDTASGPGEVHVFLGVVLTHSNLKLNLVCSRIAQGQLVNQVKALGDLRAIPILKRVITQFSTNTLFRQRGRCSIFRIQEIFFRLFKSSTYKRYSEKHLPLLPYGPSRLSFAVFLSRFENPP